MAYKDKEKQRAAGRKHYLENRVAMIERAALFSAKAQEAIRALVRETKEKSACADCGNKDPRVMDFHHIGPKDFSIGVAAQRKFSLKKVQAEIAKCVLLCANCHRIRHFIERNIDAG